MSQDSVNALTDSISNINKALKEHDFDTIINETVLGIDELLPKIHMSFLEQRVMAFKRKGDVHQAYVTSLIMTREFPTFISGFLHAARILIQQRRFEHAIVMCKDGLEKNAQLSTKDPKYQELLQVQKLAQKGQNSKVDFMKLLPYDVITLVLKRLSMDDIINCMKVSKGWEQSILSCPSSFREWRIVPPADQREYDATEYDIIQQLSEHIWSLYVILQWEELAEQQIKNLFSNVTFPHLRSFTVYLSKISREALLGILEVAADSLEEVFISFGNSFALIPDVGDRKIRACEIFDLCPNLKKLTYDTSGILEYYGAALQLQLSELHIYSGEVLAEEVEYILMNTPNIQEFSVGYCNQKVLKVFNECNNNSLRSISVNPDRFQPDIIQGHSTQQTIKCNRMIDVYYCTGVTASLLLPLLEKHKETEALTLNVTPSEPNIVQKWKAFADFRSFYLHYLMIGFTDDVEHLFASAIKNCFNLEVIKIKASNPTRITYTALESLDNLRKFELTNNTEATSLLHDDNALRAFLEYHSVLSDRSTLEEVCLRYNEGIQASTVGILSKIKNLKTIDLAGPFLEEEISINTSIQNITLTSLPLLDTVFLEGISVIDEGLKKLDCRHIRLACLDGITTPELQDIVTRSRCLEVLDVLDCENIDLGALQHVVKHNNILFNSKKQPAIINMNILF